jgi:hypothetical protein
VNAFTPFQLLLFHRDIAFSKTALDQGIDGLIVDFENKGKTARQVGFDTEINFHTLNDLDAVRTLSDAHILCRINGSENRSDQEISDVLNAGADEIIVPMIRSLDEAKAVLDAVTGAARITLMVETSQALGIVTQLCTLPVDRIYVGLNDLMISRGSATIFEPLIDGTLDEIRADIADANGVQFGFGGLTLRGQGDPLPVQYLTDELARNRADFTFLRRSFYRDLGDQTGGDVLCQMRTDIAAARARDATQSRIAFDNLKAAVCEMGAVHSA